MEYCTRALWATAPNFRCPLLIFCFTRHLGSRSIQGCPKKLHPSPDNISVCRGKNKTKHSSLQAAQWPTVHSCQISRSARNRREKSLLATTVACTVCVSTMVCYCTTSKTSHVLLLMLLFFTDKIFSSGGYHVMKLGAPLRFVDLCKDYDI